MEMWVIDFRSFYYQICKFTNGLIYIWNAIFADDTAFAFLFSSRKSESDNSGKEDRFRFRKYAATKYDKLKDKIKDVKDTKSTTTLTSITQSTGKKSQKANVVTNVPHKTTTSTKPLDHLVFTVKSQYYNHSK